MAALQLDTDDIKIKSSLLYLAAFQLDIKHASKI